MDLQNLGTSVGDFYSVSTFSTKPGVDPSGLIIWLYNIIKVKDNHKTRIVAAYIQYKS